MGPQKLSRGHFFLELSTWAVASLALHALTSSWARTVSSFIAEPYLDEVFHIRQAQAYCAGRFDQWDPKITTPPALYLISWLLHCLGFKCSVESLRQTNVALLSIVVFNASLHLLLHLSQRGRSKPKTSESDSKSQTTRAVVRKIHLSLNISLFPPLFFFSALYYTDVASTAFVLVGAWLQYHPRLATYPKLRGLCLIVNGIAALLCRQTNVFWIGVFPAALDLVDTLSQGSFSFNEADYKAFGQPSLQHVIRHSWESGVVYDPPYDLANFQDYLAVALSVGIITASKISILIKRLMPYLVLIIVFAGFVRWNGSVVLGDKSNHIATLHLPQMLYIWPFIIFFSFPLIAPHVIGAVVPSSYLPKFLLPYRSRHDNNHRFIYTLLYSFTALGIALLVIHKNTIVHPFTLADNRHYVFYVFRLLLRHPSIRYLVAPIYTICGWAALRPFSSPAPPPSSSKTSGKTPIIRKTIQSNNDEERVKTSYVLIWLATTAMTLITAPLVEPRYLILPWIFWRLRVPGPPAQPITKAASHADDKDGPTAAPNPVMTRIRYVAQILNHGDYRLYFETAWFLLVNAVTGYIFLYWGFEWPQEKGNVQRFMW